MAHYGTLDAWAGALNMNNATLLLREPLAEQKDTQLLLTGLATRTFEDE